MTNKPMTLGEVIEYRRKSKPWSQPLSSAGSVRPNADGTYPLGQEPNSLRWLPSKRLQAQLHLKIAEKRYSSNRKRSLLCTLPYEMLAGIASWLCDADLLSFLATSRWMFGTTLIPGGDYPWTTRYHHLCVGWTAFMKRMNMDLFNRLAVTEQSKTIKRKILRANKGQDVLCSFCIARHPKRFFSQSQLGTDPKFRVCLGAEGKFWACNHQAYTLTELRELIQRWRNRPTGMYVSPGAAISFGVKSVPLCDQARCTDIWNGPQFTGSGQGFKYTCTYRLSNERPGAGRLRGCDIQQVLMQMDAYICPHIRTSELTVSKEFARAEAHCSAHYGYDTHHGSSRNPPAPRLTRQLINSQKWTCEVENCDTVLFLEPETTRIMLWDVDFFDACTPLFLIVTRKPGLLESPTSPQWLAQLDFGGCDISRPRRWRAHTH